MGAQEYGELFGVTQIAVGQAALRHNGMLPAPDYVLSGSKWWLLDTVLDAAETTMQKSRKGTWQLRDEVVEALREGQYEGPGSFIARRGSAAQRAV
ncbi:hypothetical protein OHB14_61015 [Streptomyces sp. NBC_01613]|uniref:hypothetical protein n=1 Tax=Streptomyces sp. NBC_01613 TaxID=2975896 RepID=UPI00386A7AA2